MVAAGLPSPRQMREWNTLSASSNPSTGPRTLTRFGRSCRSSRPPFAKLCKEVFHARAEANDNVLFLAPLLPWFEKMERETDFTALPDLFRPILHSILLVWKWSRFYNTPPRLVVLVRQICNELIRKAFAYMNGKQLFDLIDADETLKAMNSSGASRRPIVKNELEKKHALLIASYNQDLHAVQQVFVEKRDTPPIAYNFPPFAGAVTWCRGLLDRVAYPMEKLKRLNRSVLEREDSKEVIKMYTNLVASLMEYETASSVALQAARHERRHALEGNARAPRHPTLRRRHPRELCRQRSRVCKLTKYEYLWSTDLNQMFAAFLATAWVHTADATTLETTTDLNRADLSGPLLDLTKFDDKMRRRQHSRRGMRCCGKRPTSTPSPTQSRTSPRRCSSVRPKSATGSSTRKWTLDAHGRDAPAHPTAPLARDARAALEDAPHRDAQVRVEYDATMDETVLKLWFTVQQTWLSLERIFMRSDDIRLQLPHDTKRFESIDAQLKELYADIQGRLGILDACGNATREPMLKELHGELEVCQKALNQYLDAKKDVFPRF
ncbi:Aste57867_8074 [Aphanomyces stellatus]|uniref:Aste57867_8074 protein n=1 Tax=Aphanomyces stellatus TaxID=120398 RepID=A0A485KJA1_9STRA|nr:hypothetical protein As57867_008044 [Aphanomyces stellatus]VFT84963.1 Aste57867_8074 [Aphanomyces stellatus]